MRFCNAHYSSKSLAKILSVEVTETMLGDTLVVKECTVSFVASKLIERIAAGNACHVPVAGNFCHDGSEGNNWLGLVAPDDCLLAYENSRSGEKAVETHFHIARLA